MERPTPEDGPQSTAGNHRRDNRGTSPEASSCRDHCDCRRDRLLIARMSSLTDILTGFVREAFRAEGLPEEHAVATPSNRPDLGQFQSNGALAVAKVLKRSPREIAERIRAALVARYANELRDVSLAGPGFVNISLTDDFLAAQLNRLSEDERLGVAPKPADTVILDYGGPNVSNPMHVGHLRASIIGDALRRPVLFFGIV